MHLFRVNVTPFVQHLLHDEDGQDLIEYALAAALIGVACVVALRTLANHLTNAFNTIGNNLTSAV